MLMLCCYMHLSCFCMLMLCCCKHVCELLLHAYALLLLHVCELLLHAYARLLLHACELLLHACSLLYRSWHKCYMLLLYLPHCIGSTAHVCMHPAIGCTLQVMHER